MRSPVQNQARGRQPHSIEKPRQDRLFVKPGNISRPPRCADGAKNLDGVFVLTLSPCDDSTSSHNFPGKIATTTHRLKHAQFRQSRDRPTKTGREKGRDNRPTCSLDFWHECRRVHMLDACGREEDARILFACFLHFWSHFPWDFSLRKNCFHTSFPTNDVTGRCGVSTSSWQ